MNLLFVKHSLAWPRSSGHDVHTFQLLRACGEIGHRVALATVVAPSPEAIAGARLDLFDLGEGAGAEVETRSQTLRYSRLQERFRSYWGIDRAVVARLHEAAVRFAADVVVIGGLDALAYLPGVPQGVARVWYAADEWILHHLTLISPRDRQSWRHVKAAFLKGLYERAYAPLIDRAWVVSASERRAMRWLAGVRHVDVVPNGVDPEEYRPMGAAEQPNSAVFWGRLDFEPNIQGLEWFVRTVWPAVRETAPGATFTIIGFKPGPEVHALAGLPGVELLADLPDLRTEVCKRQVVVLPFVSGGGIKNKLLEAAAMGRPIVCTPRATAGLSDHTAAALNIASVPAQWTSVLSRLWTQPGVREREGLANRTWVTRHHTWNSAARLAVAGLESALDKARPR